MTSSPLVSVIMPAYNCARTLDEAIASVVNQTWPSWELLIVVDAATDDTASIANRWTGRDARVKVFSNPTNQGVAKTRNLALAHAKGVFIAFLDSDDLWLPGKLSKQMEFMTRTGAGLCYGAYLRMNDSGMRKLVVPPEKVDRNELLRGNVIPNLTTVVTRSLIDGLYFQRVGHEDYVFWLSVLERTPLAHRLPDDEPVAIYRVQDTSLSASKWRSACWQWHIYRKTLKLSFMRSAALFAHYAVRALMKRTRGSQANQDSAGQNVDK